MFGVFYFAESFFAEGLFLGTPVPPVVIGDDGGLHMGIGQKRTFAIDAEQCPGCGGRMNRSGKVQLAGAFHAGRRSSRSEERRRRSEAARAGDGTR